MVFVLNNAQSRDTAAINAKLDSIMFAVQDADNWLIGLESRTESEAQAVIENIKVHVDGADAAVSHEAAGELQSIVAKKAKKSG